MKPEITFEDFAKLDIRIGRVEVVDAPEDLNKLYKLTVNFGEEIGKKAILAGIRKYYSPEDLSGRLVVAVVNLRDAFSGRSGVWFRVTYAVKGRSGGVFGALTFYICLVFGKLLA